MVFLMASGYILCFAGIAIFTGIGVATIESKSESASTNIS